MHSWAQPMAPRESAVAISVAVAVGDIADQLVQRLGNGFVHSKLVPVPSLVSKWAHSTKAHETGSSYVDIGEAGAQLVVDGRHYVQPGHEDGFFLGGCLFDNVTPDMRIYREEIFGPVLCVVRVADFKSALDLVNGHEFGNGTAVFTRDGDCARAFTTGVEAGMVGVNVPIPVPWLSILLEAERSLFGVQHMHGMDGVRFNTLLKTVTTRWPKGFVKEPTSLCQP